MSSPGSPAISGAWASECRSTSDSASITIRSPVPRMPLHGPASPMRLTRGRKTLLKAGAGLFYNRVPLNIAAFPEFPARTVLTLGPQGDVLARLHTQTQSSGRIRAAPPGMSNSIGRCWRNWRSA